MDNLGALLRTLRERGDAEAITAVTRDEVRRVSAGQLAEKACRLAFGLKTHGHSTGDRIALVADNSPDLIAAVLGVMGSGCVAVPINVQMEQETTKEVMKDCGARTILTSAKRVDRLTEIFGQDGPVT